MPDDFDPYYKWLGIPPEEQPPNRYRLLGIKPLEPDPDVIEAAADQRMLLLRTHQTGRHSRLSQQLLNEVAAAKVCLLNGVTKAAYDRELRQELDAEAKSKAEAKAPPPPRAGWGATVEPIGTSAEPTPSVGDVATSRPAPPADHRTRWRALALGLMAVLGTALAYAFWPNSAPDPVAAPAMATIEFLWPEEERDHSRLEINGATIDVPPTGSVKHVCEPGDYRIVARRPGYATLVRNVTVGTGEHRSVALPWRSLEAVLMIRWPRNQRNGAELSLDGQPKGLSPQTVSAFTVQPGSHTIVATRPGYREFRQTIDLGPNERMTIELQWEEAPAVSPPPAAVADAVLVCDWPEDQRLGASVRINGNPARVPPTGQCAYKLPPAAYRIVVSRPGYDPFEQIITLAAGKQTVVKVALREVKLPAPSEAQQEEIAQRLDPYYGVEMASTPEQKRELADRLFQDREQYQDSPDEQFVLLRRVMELATEGGDAQLTLDAVEAIESRFDVDLLDTRLQMWRKTAEQAETTEQSGNVASSGLLLIEECHAAGRQDLAREAVGGVLRAARKAADPALLRPLARWALLLDGESAAAGADARHPVPAEPKPPVRAPVPTGELLRKAESDVRSVFGEDRRRAKTPEDKAVLVLRVLAPTSVVSPPATADHYVRLCLARDVAAEAGDVDPVWRIIDDLAATFEVDAWAEKVAVVPTLATTAYSAGQYRELAARVLDLAEEAVAKNDADTASQLMDRGLRLARKAEVPPLVTFFVERRKEVLQALVPPPEVAAARATLDAEPLDPEANATVGRHTCLVRGDWERGIAMLALGADGPLRTQAIKDLVGAASPKQQQQLGDGWWALAAQEEGRAARKLQVRAVTWYRRALPELTSSAKKVVEGRIAEFEAAAEPPAIPPVAARVCAACASSFAIYLNGTSLVSGSGSAASIATATLKRGDVITVRAQKAASGDGFCCVIQLQDGRTITTGSAWQAYQPKAGASAYLPESIAVRSAVVPGTSTKPTSMQRVFETCGIAPPPIWASGNPSSCYLTFTIP